jgi:hypothetical protein
VKKLAVLFGVCVLAASIVVPIATSGNYSPSNSTVEGNVPGTLTADGSPRPPLPPSPSA